jgi:hypothetical protein
MAIPYDFAQQQARIQQMQMMAQMLSAQGQQPQGQMVSGRFVAPSPVQNLGALANQVGGAYAMNKAIDQQGQLGRDYKQKIAESLTAASQNPNRRAGAQSLMASGIPELVKIGESQLGTLDKMTGDSSLDARGRIALGLTGDASGLGPAGESKVVNDQLVYGIPGESPQVTYDGRSKFGPIQNVDGVSVQFEQGTNKPVQTATRAPVTNISMGENPVDKAAAPKIIDDIREARTQINGARNMNRTTDRLLTLLQDPKVTTGFLQGPRAGLANAAELLFPGDGQALVKTQSAIREASNLALDSASRMKDQGQITENERALLKDAAGGNLNFTADSLREIGSITKRIAALQVANAEDFLSKVGQNAMYKPYVDMMESAPYRDTNDIAPITPDPAATATPTNNGWGIKEVKR